MIERKAGWYWVKLKCGEWVPCEWLPDPDYPDDVECWVDAPLSPISYAGDLQFEEIGPRIHAPDETEQPPWMQAADDMLVVSGIGTAEQSDNIATAKRKLGELIDWHVAVALDERVNGGYRLVPVEAAPKP